MAITIGATSTGASAASGTSINIGSLTPDAGSNKRVIAVGFKHGTVSGSSDPMSATFGGNAMTKIAEVDGTADPRRVLAVFEYSIGSSTTAGDVVFTCSVGDRWSGLAYVLIDVPPSATPLSNTSTALSALSVTFGAAGILLDFAAVNTDDSGNTDNVITIDGAQTLIRNQNRGVGTTTEGRLATSYKSVSSGSQSGASTSPFSDGVAHIVVGYEEAGGPTYTLTAVQGTYSLTGQASGLIAARRLTAAQGSYALTGNAANLVYTPAGGPTYTLVASQGSYALTGQAAGLIAGRRLTAAQGSYALTGQAAGLYRGYVLTAAQGSYALTGQAAAFRRGYALTAASGEYSLTGYAATLTYSGQGLWTVQAPASPSWSPQSASSDVWTNQAAAGGSWTVQ